MRTQPFLTSMGLLLALCACVAPSTPLPLTEDATNKTAASSNGLTAETSSVASCELANSNAKPNPLSTAENEPIFEQFNFRPQEIAVTDNAVTLTSAHHIFAYCQPNDTWSITSAAASEDEPPYDYEQELAQIADPDYQTIEVENQTYKYRIRLQAEWLQDQLKPDTFNPEEIAPEENTNLETASEDAVFFELEKPDGELITQQLYTLSELQDAQLGASLGPPEIAGTATLDTDIWFAATASQGEGDSGFASLIHYNASTNELNVDKPEEIQGDQITSLAITQGPILFEEEKTATSSAETENSEEETEATEETETTENTANAEETEVTEETEATEDTANADQTADSTAKLDNEPTAEASITETTTEAPITLWLGTQRSGEGVPYFPASGLVAYQPDSQKIKQYTVNNSPLIGAIPHQIAAKEDSLWVGTGNGTCQINWSTIAKRDSWSCWKFTATAELPSDGVEVFDSFLAESPTATLNKDTVEVLWANQSSEENEAARTLRYEVVYEPGFETQLSQGGYRISNKVARRAAEAAAEETDIFWPGNQWHWNGQKFERGLDEVALNLVGGGPYGLVTGNNRQGFDFDSNAIRGKFDLLELTAEHTKVRYYSGWIESAGIAVYPTVIPATSEAESKPNPLTEMAAELTSTQGP